MANWFRKWFGKSEVARQKPATDRQIVPVSRFDAAQTTDQNYRHWANADQLGPNVSTSHAVRKILRERARYERDNDPHLNGLTRTLANDLIGSGPRLQICADSDDNLEDVRKVERCFTRWARSSGLTQALRLMTEARPVDGESFALLALNKQIAHPVKLEIRPFEADLVTNQSITQSYSADENLGTNGTFDDGIEYDSEGNPTRYCIHRAYPTDPYVGAVGFDLVDAAVVLHWYRPYRPGQRRGISDFTSSLGVVSQLRRYSQAVLAAAEFGASIAGVMSTNSSSVSEPVDVAAMDKVEISPGSLMTLPQGWQANQFKSEQPTGGYNQYADAKRAEMARPVGAPFNVVSGNSSGYNYSSGRLDHVPYHRQVWIEREALRKPVLDRIAMAWLKEAFLLGLIPESLGSIEEIEFEWQWDSFGSVDPMKDAEAAQLRMQIGMSTLAEECAYEGKNWRDVLEQLAVERKLRIELGLPDTFAGNSQPSKPSPPTDPGQTADPADGNEAADPANATDTEDTSGGEK